MSTKPRKRLVSIWGGLPWMAVGCGVWRVVKDTPTSSFTPSPDPLTILTRSHAASPACKQLANQSQPDKTDKLALTRPVLRNPCCLTAVSLLSRYRMGDCRVTAHPHGLTSIRPSSRANFAWSLFNRFPSPRSPLPVGPFQVSRPDLVGEHVGETAPKTRKVLILFEGLWTQCSTNECMHLVFPALRINLNFSSRSRSLRPETAGL